MFCCADTNGNQASSDGNYAGGPWVWLGGNDCQASAVAIASSNGNDGSDAYAQAAACKFPYTSC